jgi:hypothetical protein
VACFAGVDHRESQQFLMKALEDIDVAAFVGRQLQVGLSAGQSDQDMRMQASEDFPPDGDEGTCGI